MGSPETTADGGLVRRLTREIGQNKGKAAVLGLLCLVAVWFWAPLVRKHAFAKAPPTAGDATSAGDSASDSAHDSASDSGANVVTGNGSATPETSSETVLDWKALEVWRKTEPRMTPISIDAGWANPFARIEPDAPPTTVVETDGGATDPAPSDASAEPVTPESAGLTLRGTILSPRGALANINGQLLGVGGALRVGATDVESEGIEFRVVSIESDHVVVDRSGTSFRIDVVPPRRDDDGRIVIRPASR
ncbi:MAG: hypothetical protein FJ297_09285 [Planctomycetes bacterium]|nr:hypothetical protein [Planctomycetota bacterium]